MRSKRRTCRYANVTMPKKSTAAAAAAATAEFLSSIFDSPPRLIFAIFSDFLKIFLIQFFSRIFDRSIFDRNTYFCNFWKIFAIFSIIQNSIFARIFFDFFRFFVIFAIFRFLATCSYYNIPSSFKNLWSMDGGDGGGGGGGSGGPMKK